MILRSVYVLIWTNALFFQAREILIIFDTLIDICLKIIYHAHSPNSLEIVSARTEHGVLYPLLIYSWCIFTINTDYLVHCLTERLLLGHKESNQTNKQYRLLHKSLVARF